MSNVVSPSGLPSGWAWVELGDLAEVNPRRPTTSELQHENLVTFVPMSAVEQETGIADFSTLRPLTEVARGYTAFRESDILFAKITPCMENGKVLPDSSSMVVRPMLLKNRRVALLSKLSIAKSEKPLLCP